MKSLTASPVLPSPVAVTCDHQPRPLPLLLLALGAAGLTCGTVAHAAGLQVMEQNVSGLGTAYAGSAAVSEGAGSQYYNPASLTRVALPQVTLGAVASSPTTRFHDSRSTGDSDVTPDTLRGHVWLALPLSGLSSQITLGVGISQPYGLKAEYREVPWRGEPRYLAASLKSQNINPAVAWQVNEALSLGFGLNFQHLDAESTSRSSATQLIRHQGSGDALGWNAGFQYALSPAMRVGLAYRSGLHYRLEGSSTQSGNSLTARSDLDLPDSLTWSVHQQVSDEWEAMGDLAYTRWRNINSLQVTDSTGNSTSDDYKLRNSWRLAWGAAYKASEQLKWRFGLAYESSPVNPGQSHPYLPQGDRYWLAAGLTYWPWASTRIDLGYNWRWSRQISVNHRSSSGVSQGNYDSSSHVLGLEVSQSF